MVFGYQTQKGERSQTESNGHLYSKAPMPEGTRQQNAACSLLSSWGSEARLREPLG